MNRTGLLLAAGIMSLRPLAADPVATVTEKVNDVSKGSPKVAGTQAATVGSKLEDGQYLKTGVKSRAELQLANLSVTRLGANTIFTYSPTANEIDLQAGTVLFSKPKDSSQMTIKTASVTAAVLGTTGFVQQKGKTFIFGLIEGHAKVTIGGVTYSVGAGDILRFTPGSPPQIVAYNVPHFLETSPLLIDYHNKLPNQAFIDKEVATYDDLVARGFITPVSGPSFTDIDGAVPAVPTGSTDQAQRSHYVFNVQQSPPTGRAGNSGETVVPSRPRQPF